MWNFFQQTLLNPALGLIWGLIGFLIGNKLALGRDKRREFNKIIEPIRTNLLEEKISGGHLMVFVFTNIDILKIREKLPFWKRRRFDIAIKKYKESKNNENIESNSMGGASFKNTEIVIHAINKLLKFIKEK